MSYLDVQSIFRSIDGEVNGYAGAGQPSTFVRLSGCNLRCRYCDTVYAQDSAHASLGSMSVEEILQELDGFPGRKVTLTGGEALTQAPQVAELLGQLLRLRYEVTVETNGSISLRKTGLWCFPRTGDGSVRFVVDYKLPSSGMEDYMDKTIWQDLTEYDVVKFVVSDNCDFDRAVSIIRSQGSCKASVSFSPAIDPLAENPMDWPSALADRLATEHHLPRTICYNLQIHKVLWPNATRER